MATPRQIAANRENAQKSTGPTTEEGKARARGNALKHGLAGAGVVLPGEQSAAVETRMAEWREAFRPDTVDGEWLFEDLVVNSVRVEHCRRLEDELRGYEARRAALCWDDDRRLDAEETAAALRRDPSRVSRRLSRSRQGCEWLTDRWRGLAAVIERGGEWTDAQRTLSLDLLGTPAELRDGLPAGDPLALAAREIARLERLIAEALDELDDVEREAAGVGLGLTTSRVMAQLRRYEAACMRRFTSARHALRSPGRPADPNADAYAETDRPAPPTPPPAPSAPPAMTDDDWRAYESLIFRDAFARLAAKCEAEAPAPEEAEAPAPEEAEAYAYAEAPEPISPEPPAVVAAAPVRLLNHTMPSGPCLMNRQMRRASGKNKGKKRS